MLDILPYKHRQFLNRTNTQYTSISIDDHVKKTEYFAYQSKKNKNIETLILNKYSKIIISAIGRLTGFYTFKLLTAGLCSNKPSGYFTTDKILLCDC